MDYFCHRNRAVILQNIQAFTGNLLKITHKTIHALELAKDYSKCYPYMDAKRLVDILLETWENVCALRSTDKMQIQRKYGLLKADTRTEKTLLLSVENLLIEVRGMIKLKPGFVLLHQNELYNKMDVLCKQNAVH